MHHSWSLDPPRWLPGVVLIHVIHGGRSPNALAPALGWNDTDDRKFPNLSCWGASRGRWLVFPRATPSHLLSSLLPFADGCGRPVQWGPAGASGGKQRP
jgi:hypothetical protein